MEILALQKILKLGILLLDTTHHVHERFSQHGCKNRSICINGVNRADRYKVRVSKYIVLPIFVLSVNYCVIYKCSRWPPPSESPCRFTSYSLRKGIKLEPHPKSVNNALFNKTSTEGLLVPTDGENDRNVPS